MKRGRPSTTDTSPLSNMTRYEIVGVVVRNPSIRFGPLMEKLDGTLSRYCRGKNAKSASLSYHLRVLKRPGHPVLADVGGGMYVTRRGFMDYYHASEFVFNGSERPAAEI